MKINDIQKLSNFQSEYYGLQQLAATDTVRVPQPLFVGEAAAAAVMIMEYLPLTRATDGDLWRQMGADLARLHLTPIAEINAALRRAGAAPAASLPEGRFGGTISNSTLGDRDGFLGTAEDWPDFFCRHRLQFQFEQARQIHSTRFALEDRLLSVAHRLLRHNPSPALTHGDLWAGNAAFAHRKAQSPSGGRASATQPQRVAPVMFDPAPYVADAETDLGLTELFGGFPAAFYDGYNRVRPIDSGYRHRRAVYNLYHVLNHYNLFGGGYRRQAETMIDDIISLSAG